MPRLLSGSTLRRGGSGEFLDLAGAQPQLPPTDTTSTGYTLVTDDKLRTSYRSSLGNIQMHLGEMYSNLPSQNIRIVGTDSSLVIVAGGTANTGTSSGALIVDGGIGIKDGLHSGKDIYVNGLRIGRGYEGINNIVVSGIASPQYTTDDDGQQSIVVGYDALQGLASSYKSVAIGRYALSSGTNISNAIAIGDSALKDIGVFQSIPVATVTNITLANPVVVTAPNHTLTSGTYVTFQGIVGTTELNEQKYYVWVQNSSTFALYTDINLNNSLDGTGFTAYVSDGTVETVAVFDDNIGIGIDAGKSLKDGIQNIFVGDKVAKFITSGSFNILIGHEVGNNLTQGSGNISVGGDNLVDGQDNQVNIGSVFYFDGKGYTQINSNLGTGIGAKAEALSYLDDLDDFYPTNPVKIKTKIWAVETGTRIFITGLNGAVELNDQFYFASYAGTGTGSTHFTELYYDVDLTQPVDGTAYSLYINSGTVYTLEPTGSLSVLGGVGINGNLIVTDQADFYSGMTVKNLITGTITTSTNLAGGNIGSIPYQSGSGLTQFINIGSTNTVLTSNGTTATWEAIGGLSAGTAGTATNALNLFVNPVTSEIVYYPTVASTVGDFGPIDADTSFTYVTTTATTSSYYSSGTSVLNVPGSIYSNEGNEYENNLVYSPRVTVSLTAPPNPRIGDFWIDPSLGVELQYIDDGGNRFWIQFTGI